MKVEQYQADQVSTRVVDQPRASANVPSAAFGSPITQGVADIGNAFAQMRQRVDTTLAEEANVQFEREKNKILFDPENGYFNTQGRSAFDVAEPTNKALEDLRKKYSDGLSGNARSMFDRVATAQLTRTQQEIGRHASQGLKAWEVATVQAQVENSIENASLYWNDPKAMNVQNTLGRQAVIDAAEMQGITGEALNERLQTYDSSFARTAVEAATMHSSTKGTELLESFGKRIEGPDKLKLEAMIAGKANAEKTQADAQYAVVKATELVGKYDRREDLIAEVDKISDPELRDKTMSETMHQFSMRKQAESEARGAAYEGAEKYILQGGSVEEFQAENPDDWLRLSPSQQKNLKAGKANSTNWETYSDLMTLPKAELAKIDPVEYYDKLAPEQRNSLISAVRSAKNSAGATEKQDSQVGRSRIAQTTASVEQLFGPKAKRNDEEKQRVEQFYALLDDEVAYREAEKGGKLTSDEFTNVLAGFTRKAVVERNWLSNKEMSITDIPVEDVQPLTDFLRQNKIPITAENLIKAYRQASQ